MKLKRAIVVMFLFILIVAACDNTTENKEDFLGEVVEVEIELEPETPRVNTDTTIKAIVTQGKDKVNDANEVIFEVWKEGQEDHEMIEASNQGDGIYSITKQFKTEGNYFVVSHVTARDMHVMPRKAYTVAK
ncbi:FixH family protein [Aquibacillus koreensis]|uniref:FixH family protein n=1 Tax=Aquibacillus koreensis TaxID=279446 RepID=A0A9X4AII0_9BACI|nr:FixH family protein [Aquibacillus koreensis]MCT2536502.1 FixH family protein [Aquibacillus koreensis]MDC3419410.1 FixH family protein [Aquibacillus koreensis]